MLTEFPASQVVVAVDVPGKEETWPAMGLVIGHSEFRETKASMAENPQSVPAINGEVLRQQVSRIERQRNPGLLNARETRVAFAPSAVQP